MRNVIQAKTIFRGITIRVKRLFVAGTGDDLRQGHLQRPRLSLHQAASAALQRVVQRVMRARPAYALATAPARSIRNSGSTGRMSNRDWSAPVMVAQSPAPASASRGTSC